MWIKICGLVRQEDAERAASLGADALGFVFEPTSPRCVGGLDWNPSWLAGLQPEKVGVFGPAPAELPAAGFHTIQASDWSKAGGLQGIQRQVVARVGYNDDADRIVRNAPGAHRLVLDAFSRLGYGGTGQLVDWNLAREVVKKSPVPVVLAGGLTPENVGEAILKVRPFGVDVSSGVETAPGVKDPAKLEAFITNTRMAYAMLLRQVDAAEEPANASDQEEADLWG